MGTSVVGHFQTVPCVTSVSAVVSSITLAGIMRQLPICLAGNAALPVSAVLYVYSPQMFFFSPQTATPCFCFIFCYFPPVCPLCILTKCFSVVLCALVALPRNGLCIPGEHRCRVCLLSFTLKFQTGLHFALKINQSILFILLTRISVKNQIFCTSVFSNLCSSPVL